MTRLFFYALAVTLLIVTIHACDLLETSDPYPEGKASVRIVHVAPMAPSVQYFHKEDVVFTGLGFGDVTEYVDVPVGRNPDGFLDADGDTLIFRDDLAGNFLDMRFLDYERNFTVFAIHGGAATGNVHIRSMEIEPTPNAEGQVRLRVLHAVSDAPAVDIYLTEPGGSISDENLFLLGIGFNNEGGDAATAPAEMPLYFPTDPGTYEVKLTAAESSEVIFSQEVVLDASRNYTMVIFPTEANDDVDRVMLLPDN
ncbi:MAG: DUF4397 domain-containing protein [Balneolaceae bacterium]|nr:MAG: DUF4397 domain-containing protein [Balneolaceae bacterium]